MSQALPHAAAPRSAFQLNETIAVGAILALATWAVISWAGIGGQAVALGPLDPGQFFPDRSLTLADLHDYLAQQVRSSPRTAKPGSCGQAPYTRETHCRGRGCCRCQGYENSVMPEIGDATVGSLAVTTSKDSSVRGPGYLSGLVRGAAAHAAAAGDAS
jgi:hypothetical protein